MRELWPSPTDQLDVAARLAADDRPPWPDRPWVTLIMIMSLDGAIEIDGVSGALGGPADHDRFVAARRQTDGIVVGAGTVSAENYRAASVPIAVLTRSLSLDPGLRLFDDPERPPLLFTTAAAAADRGPDFADAAEIIDLGDDVEPQAVLAELHRRGMRSVMLEGGPTINGLFFAADLVDEILLTLSPLAVVGDGTRLATGPALGAEHRYVVDRISIADDLVFVRYLRSRSG